MTNFSDCAQLIRPATSPFGILDFLADVGSPLLLEVDLKGFLAQATDGLVKAYVESRATSLRSSVDIGILRVLVELNRTQALENALSFLKVEKFQVPPSELLQLALEKGCLECIAPLAKHYSDFDSDKLWAYYQEHYGPNNALLALHPAFAALAKCGMPFQVSDRVLKLK